jgi:hypothetical protein
MCGPHCNPRVFYFCNASFDFEKELGGFTVNTLNLDPVLSEFAEQCSAMRLIAREAVERDQNNGIKLSASCGFK